MTDTVRMRACHEAGHAVAALSLGVRVERLSLEAAESVRSGRPLDAFCDLVFDSRKDLESVTGQRVIVAYSGAVAQALCSGSDPITVIEQQDADRESVAEQMALLENIMSSEDANALRRGAWNRAIEIITMHNRTVEAVADALATERHLTEQQIEDIWRAAPSQEQ
jgi:hypothetical protein